nr:MAG: capsid protein [Cressdnaviricota sp.]
MKRNNFRKNYSGYTKYITPAMSIAGAAYKAYTKYNRKPRAAYKKKAVKTSNKMYTNTSKSGRVYKKRTYRPKVRVIPKLVKQVKELNRQSKADEATMTYRVRTTGRILSAVNQQTFDEITAVSVTSLETVLAVLKYYDPAVPGTLVTADGAVGTYSKEFMFSRQYCRAVIRNNYQSPVRLSVYLQSVKEDTSIPPSTAYSNGLLDVGGISATSPLSFVSDSRQYRDLWHIVSSKKVELQPGEEYVCTYSTKPFVYDPSLVDSHPDAHQHRYKAYAISARVEGIIGHDTVADQQGILQGGVDWCCDRTWVVTYNAGINLEYHVNSDQSDAFTTGPVASQKPIPDNINYSVV